MKRHFITILLLAIILTAMGCDDNIQNRTTATKSPIVENKQKQKVMVSRGKTKVTIENEGKINKVVLEKNGNKSVLESAEAVYEKDNSNMPRVKIFSDPQLDSNGRFLFYSMTGWEVNAGNLFNVEKQRKVKEFFGSSTMGFTPDGKFAYACAANDLGGEYYGTVISLETEETVFDVPEEAFKILPAKVSCKMQNNQIIFSIKSDDPYNSQKFEKTYRYPK